ncbi:MAG: ABC transporter substrate-binding protein [Myxococcota bacterium]
MTKGSAAMLLATLCLSGVGCRGGDGPAEVVRGLHEDVRAGEFDAVHARFNYAWRLEEVLGDIWREAPVEEQERMLATSREMFEDTTRRYWDEEVGDRPFALEREEGEDGAIHVTARVAGPEEGRPDFAWAYRLHRRGDRWRVTRREVVVDGVRGDTTRFWKTVVAALSRDLGRPPTLREVRANLPSWEGRIRARVYQVPEDLGEGRE